jgi:SAM-dependent methyltransferase
MTDAFAKAEECCPVCAALSPPLAFVKKGYPMHRCTRCEVVFSARPPAAAELEKLYSASYFIGGGAGYPGYIADERTHRRQAQRYLRRIAKLGIDGRALLDVGCAAGFFLDEARKQGWIVSGCELSEYAHRHAEGELGLKVTRAGFLDLGFAPLPESFDLITMFNVLEHIPDPPRVAAKVLQLVRPGGHLFVETWDPRSWLARLLGARWPTYAPPTVIYCYTRETLRRLFSEEHWSLVTYRPTVKWISVDHGLSLLEYEAQGTPFAGAVRALRKTWLARQDVPYCLGDLAIAVFRRTALSVSSKTRPRSWNGASSAGARASG